MAHAGEKIGLGGVSLLRGHQRGGQLLLLTLFLADHIGHVGPCHAHPLQLPADVEYLNPLDAQAAAVVAHLHAERVGRLMLQLFLHILKIQTCKVFPLCRAVHKTVRDAADLLLEYPIPHDRVLDLFIVGNQAVHPRGDVDLRDHIVSQRRDLHEQLFPQLLFGDVKGVEKCDNIVVLRIYAEAEAGASPKRPAAFTPAQKIHMEIRFTGGVIRQHLLTV